MGSVSSIDVEVEVEVEITVVRVSSYFSTGAYLGGQRGHLPWVQLPGGHKIVPREKNTGSTISHTPKIF